ncbi:hypothetical protein SAMN05443633_12062 [Chryseobacterium arachidis]|uniref:Uncharacterized protein n=1 Tax=Chryseobacterium arachidis TaxID=1416778 RepID=A0A1M5LZ35_9FLAO|nr:hypothetical protein [Chryseobacterium arachidis]SHG69939.1 hypothetical protein SAMN05443633_12062 [Chryseobacterium arachidis]
MKQLSERALRFVEKLGKSQDFEIDLEIVEKHLRLYDIQSYPEIISFQKNFSGLNLQNIVIHIFTSKQIKENKGVNTYHWKGQTLFSINDSLYIAENGEIAVRDCGCDSYDFYFYYESFATFIEQQAFFEKHRYYKKLPSIFYEIQNIEEFSKSMSGYDFLKECSDKYNLIWRNGVNLVHATNSSDIWSVVFDSISEQNRYDLVNKLKEKHLIS